MQKSSPQKNPREDDGGISTESEEEADKNDDTLLFSQRGKRSVVVRQNQLQSDDEEDSEPSFRINWLNAGRYSIERVPDWSLAEYLVYHCIQIRMPKWLYPSHPDFIGIVLDTACGDCEEVEKYCRCNRPPISTGKEKKKGYGQMVVLGLVNVDPACKTQNQVRTLLFLPVSPNKHHRPVGIDIRSILKEVFPDVKKRLDSIPDPDPAVFERFEKLPIVDDEKMEGSEGRLKNPGWKREKKAAAKAVVDYPDDAVETEEDHSSSSSSSESDSKKRRGKKKEDKKKSVFADSYAGDNNNEYDTDDSFVAPSSESPSEYDSDFKHKINKRHKGRKEKKQYRKRRYQCAKKKRCRFSSSSSSSESLSSWSESEEEEEVQREEYKRSRSSRKRVRSLLEAKERRLQDEVKVLTQQLMEAKKDIDKLKSAAKIDEDDDRRKKIPLAPRNDRGKIITIKDVLRQCGLQKPSTADCIVTGTYARQICAEKGFDIPPMAPHPTYRTLRTLWTKDYEQAVLVPAAMKHLQEKRIEEEAFRANFARQQQRGN